VEWLDEQVSLLQSKQQRQIVIFTHYSPTKLSQANDFHHTQDHSGVGTAFVTDLQDRICWKSSNVKLWAFGHTHFNCDFVNERTGMRVVANQKGYRRQENASFQPELVVSIANLPEMIESSEKKKPYLCCFQ
jgi:hypothetical protein